MKRAATVFAAIAMAGLPLTGTAFADTPAGGGADNVVNAINNTGGTMYRAHTQIAFVGGNDVQPSNIADAVSTNCTGCRTRAVAVQIVIATGGPLLFTPADYAASFNSSCTACDTAAVAYQDVIQAGPGAHLTDGAEQQIGAIEAQITTDATDPTLSDSQMAADVNALGAELGSVVKTDLVSDGSGVLGDTVNEQAPVQDS